MESMISVVQTELSRRRDPDAAAAMAAYMKTDMPFYGVKAPERREIVRVLRSHYAPATNAEYRSQVEALWALAHREEKYLAIAVARAHPAYIDASNLDLYERLVVEGGWWDLVDEVAVHLVGPVHRGRPEATVPVLRRWIESDDLWLRRAAIICQNGSGPATDVELLREFVERTASETEFFIRKAIGWSLRELAKHDPATVRMILDDLDDRLSSLSIREASKHL